MTLPAMASESRLYFERGGPAYKLMQRLNVVRGDDPSIARRIVIFLALTWIPLVVLSLVEGIALGPTPEQSFLLDFASYARFFVGFPMLILAESLIGPRLTTAGLHFVRSGLVREEDYPAFDSAAEKVAARREALLPELVILGISVLGAWSMTAALYAGQGTSWHVIRTESGVRLSMAGVWYLLVAVPLLQFMFYRWIWRLVIWTGFLRDLSRLNLRLAVVHPDQAAGLGFLGAAHVSFGALAFGLGSVLSASAAFLVVFEGADMESFKIPFGAYLVLVNLIFLGPLLVFVPLLARTRRRGLLEFSALADRYDHAFMEKWIRGKSPADEPLLGTGDIQSLADLGNSYQFARQMKLFPFSLQEVIKLSVIAAAPMLPLLPLVMPVEQILKVLAKALL
ncbi:MAG: hypothetical protein A4E73_02604 [Syntrophaceae bacterium PtaU1.Bin231]|nr:MAG: hypothetical protein A4E73_02604 [Syntrophaceae bacterium PtaU1.Bin231]